MDGEGRSHEAAVELDELGAVAGLRGSRSRSREGYKGGLALLSALSSYHLPLFDYLLSFPFVVSVSCQVCIVVLLVVFQGARKQNPVADQRPRLRPRTHRASPSPPCT